ncbi:hypothetical protein B0T20DRAFT_388527 [Sordaria brevicollis]|uniref:Uncharacterized protein n=1 Tax=Sordaria brevicollis TaxID=83679 RepID=A0AAE0UG65_SORBR|nr:hypothetical protein B0T20DRAFT_388527 [Sordaria brevicollis]
MKHKAWIRLDWDGVGESPGALEPWSHERQHYTMSFGYSRYLRRQTWSNSELLDVCKSVKLQGLPATTFSCKVETRRNVRKRLHSSNSAYLQNLQEQELCPKLLHIYTIPRLNSKQILQLQIIQAGLSPFLTLNASGLLSRRSRVQESHVRNWWCCLVAVGRGRVRKLGKGVIPRLQHTEMFGKNAGRWFGVLSTCKQQGFSRTSFEYFRNRVGYILHVIIDECDLYVSGKLMPSELRKPETTNMS